MSNERKLEAYLARLEKALSQVPVGDRAEIILEIKSHVHESRERHPEESLSSILEGLGEPESVANKYLIERGLKPGKASKSPIVKWLTIGFLGTLAIFIFSGVLLIWKFTPIISIKEKDDETKVTILGGLISINEDSDRNYTWKSNDSDRETFHLKGTSPIKESHQRVKIFFENTKAELSWEDRENIEWDCKFTGSEPSDIANSEESDITLSMSGDSKCEITIPQNLKLYLSALNGKIDLENPTEDYEVDLTNGVVKIHPDSEKEFYYDLKTTHGTIDSFKSTKNTEKSKSAKVSIINGTIKNSK